MANSYGWIKLNRSILEWGWYADGNTMRVFIDILLHANFHEGEYKGMKLMPGDCIIGRKAMAQRLGMSEQEVRTALKHLHQTGEISTRKSTRNGRLVHIEKWGFYQGDEPTINQQINQQSTSNQPAINHIQEGKEGIKENNYYYSDKARLLDDFLNECDRKDTYKLLGIEV